MTQLVAVTPPGPPSIYLLNSINLLLELATLRSNSGRRREVCV
jgi:hypothetical protein